MRREIILHHITKIHSPSIQRRVPTAYSQAALMSFWKPSEVYMELTVHCDPSSLGLLLYSSITTLSYSLFLSISSPAMWVGGANNCYAARAGQSCILGWHIWAGFREKKLYQLSVLFLEFDVFFLYAQSKRMVSTS